MSQAIYLVNLATFLPDEFLASVEWLCVVDQRNPLDCLERIQEKLSSPVYTTESELWCHTLQYSKVTLWNGHNQPNSEENRLLFELYNQAEILTEKKTYKSTRHNFRQCFQCFACIRMEDNCFWVFQKLSANISNQLLRHQLHYQSWRPVVRFSVFKKWKKFNLFHALNVVRCNNFTFPVHHPWY